MKADFASLRNSKSLLFFAYTVSFFYCGTSKSGRLVSYGDDVIWAVWLGRVPHQAMRTLRLCHRTEGRTRASSDSELGGVIYGVLSTSSVCREFMTSGRRAAAVYASRKDRLTARFGPDRSQAADIKTKTAGLEVNNVRERKTDR